MLKIAAHSHVGPKSSVEFVLSDQKYLGSGVWVKTPVFHMGSSLDRTSMASKIRVFRPITTEKSNLGGTGSMVEGRPNVKKWHALEY